MEFIHDIAVAMFWFMVFALCLYVTVEILLQPLKDLKRSIRDEEQDEKTRDIAERIYMKYMDEMLNDAKNKEETTDKE